MYNLLVGLFILVYIILLIYPERKEGIHVDKEDLSSAGVCTLSDRFMLCEDRYSDMMMCDTFNELERVAADFFIFTPEQLEDLHTTFGFDEEEDLSDV